MQQSVIFDGTPISSGGLGLTFARGTTTSTTVDPCGIAVSGVMTPRYGRKVAVAAPLTFTPTNPGYNAYNYYLLGSGEAADGSTPVWVLLHEDTATPTPTADLLFASDLSAAPATPYQITYPATVSGSPGYVTTGGSPIPNIGYGYPGDTYLHWAHHACMKDGLVMMLCSRFQPDSEGQTLGGDGPYKNCVIAHEMGESVWWTVLNSINQPTGWTPVFTAAGTHPPPSCGTVSFGLERAAANSQWCFRNYFPHYNSDGTLDPNTVWFCPTDYITQSQLGSTHASPGGHGFLIRASRNPTDGSWSVGPLYVPIAKQNALYSGTHAHSAGVISRYGKLYYFTVFGDTAENEIIVRVCNDPANYSTDANWSVMIRGVCGDATANNYTPRSAQGAGMCPSPTGSLLLSADNEANVVYEIDLPETITAASPNWPLAHPKLRLKDWGNKAMGMSVGNECIHIRSFKPAQTNQAYGALFSNAIGDSQAVQNNVSSRFLFSIGAQTFAEVWTYDTTGVRMFEPAGRYFLDPGGNGAGHSYAPFPTYVTDDNKCAVSRRPLCVSPGGTQLAQRLPHFRLWDPPPQSITFTACTWDNTNKVWLWPSNPQNLSGPISPQPPGTSTPYLVYTHHNYVGNTDGDSTLSFWHDLNPIWPNTDPPTPGTNYSVMNLWVMGVRDAVPIVLSVNHKDTDPYKNAIVTASRWYPILWSGIADYFDNFRTNQYDGSQSSSALGAAGGIQATLGSYCQETIFLICFDISTFNNKRVPYPIPVIENPTSTTPVAAPHEQAMITGLFPADVAKNGWTIAVHIAFPDNWDSYWAARSESDWPLFTLHQYPAYEDYTIEVRMYAGTSADAPQTIKAIVRDNSGSTIATIALPTNPGFYAHSGSPIWIALSLQDDDTLTLAARVGAGTILTNNITSDSFDPLVPNVCVFAGWNASTWTPNDVTPLLVFSLITEDAGRDFIALTALLNSASLITGSF